jgi:type III restriction enzyme
MTAPKSLIINSPYDVPTRHWQQGRDGNLTLVDERRSAGYEIRDTRTNTLRFEELQLVNEIRGRVQEWREADYAGVTGVTRRLLEHWFDQDARQHPFYFCQLEAIETLIWFTEALPEFRQGIFLPGDGGAWDRICSKMATGTGKTTVMAMIITWQTLNALTYPKRKEFSSAIFLVAPGLTVKERLRVLLPGETDNYYDDFGLCPSESMRQKLNQADILIENWHTLMPLKEVQRSVVKKGKESDEAFARRVLGKLADRKDLIIINDEAHHAYRIPEGSIISKKHASDQGQDLEEATRWIEGLDRIHKTRRIRRCFDLSATPFIPSGNVNTESALFDWIVSDFGLNDAIESGLVKTPRVVIRDDALPDAKTYRSKLYHIYRDPTVSEDLNRKADAHESLPLLVQHAYTLLGADWRETANQWKSAGHASPPVMLTVCNRTETAARIEYYFNQGNCHWSELKDPGRTLRVDSKVLDKAEVGDSSGTDKAYEARLQEIVDRLDLPETRKKTLRDLKKEELLREIIDNVGKQGKAGQDLQNVISVAMLSEGWDAKNVTHIMGLRAFTSQLLCEQVIGRGLRRVSYDQEDVTDVDGVTRRLFRPEYVNVFGVPLSVFQDAGGGGEAPPPPKPSVQIESLPERNLFEIRWPNVLRVDAIVKCQLTVDWNNVDPLEIDPAQTQISAELAPAVGAATAMDQVTEIDLESLPDEFRLQKLIFKAAQAAFADMQQRFDGGRELLLVQLVRLVEQFIESDRLVIPSLYHQDSIRKRILIALNLDLLVQHLLRFIDQQNFETLEPVFDQDHPIGSTAEMRTWYTTKPNQPTVKSQISHTVFDQTSWEKFTADALEASELVESYAKNDHLNFQVYYSWNGSKRKFVPDFLVRFKNGKMLVLEVKGQDSEQNRAKRAAMNSWCKAVSQKGGFGVWVQDVLLEPSRINDLLTHHGVE